MVEAHGMNVNERNSVSACTHTCGWGGMGVGGNLYVQWYTYAGVDVQEEVVCMCRSVSYATANSVYMLCTLLGICTTV